MAALGHSSATNRIINARDRAAVQINIGHLDENGVYIREYTTVALSGEASCGREPRLAV